MINNLREFLKPVADIVARPFMRIHPNVLSFMSFIVVAPGFYFLSQGDTLKGSLFILGALFDSIDGVVARTTGKTSKFGGVLDATLDRVFDGLLLFFLTLGKIITWELGFLLLISFVSISYIKAKAEAVSKSENVGTNKFSVGLMQRGDRLVMIFLACFVDYFLTPQTHKVFLYVAIFMLILSVITLVYRGIVIKQIVEA